MRALLHIVQSRLIAVVAVGDDQPFIGHGGGQQPDRRRVADAPQPVRHSVFVGHLGLCRSGALVQNLLYASTWVRVQHEDLPEVGARGTQQVQPVAFRLGKRMFMTENYLLGVLVKLAQGDKAPAFLYHSGRRNLEALAVGKNTGIFLLDKDALLAPRPKIPGSTCIDVFASIDVKQFRQA